MISLNKMKKIGSLFVAIGMTATSMAATCTLGSTDFDVSSSLCTIDLTNDADGWFSDEVGDLLSELAATGCTWYGSPSDVIQTGITTYSLHTPGALITQEAWQADSVTNDAAKNTVGYSAIVSNPKLISPILGSGSGSAMLVNFGTSHDKSYIFSYTATGLEPGSEVTFTVDVYNLLDYESLAASAEAQGLKDGNIKIFGSDYNISQGKWYGNGNSGLNCKFSTSLNSNGALNGGVEQQVQQGSMKTCTYTGTADENGSISFYVGRSGGQCGIPLGFDNIRVDGQIKPVISYSGNPCPAMPILIRLKDSYPSGTTYSWTESVTGKTGTGSSFNFEAPAAGTYSIQATVTVPGCEPATSDVYSLTVNDCCSDEDGNPMAMVDVFFDDFGSFSGTQYTYTDLNGEQQTVTATDLLNGKKPCVSDLKNNGTAVKFKYNHKIYSEGYAISTIDPYTGNLISHDGDKNGGFLVMDIKTSGWNGKSLYEQQVCGLCPGKEVTFGAAIGAINTNTSSSVGTLSVELIGSDGSTLYSSGDKKLTRPEWIWCGETFTLPAGTEGCATMKIVSKEDNYSANERGDFALDDITFRVCSPPDINMDYSLTGKAQDLLDLCTDDLLTLEGITSSASEKYYGSTMSYMFQYTYDDPKTTDADKVNWITMADESGNTIFKSSKFEIKDPADHAAFEKIKDGEEAEVYFRVVVGKEETLKDPAELKVSALSPCRNISVSTMYVTAGLNCAKCTEPDANVFTVDGGKFNSTKNIVEMCEEDQKVSISLKNDIHGTDKDGKDYYDYTVSWYKGESVEKGTLISGTSKVTTSTDSKGSVLEVNYADVTEAGVEYTVYIHDNFDANPTTCDKEYTITVKALPKPTDVLTDPDAFCEGTLTTSPDATITGATVTWYEDATATTAMTSAPDITTVTAAESPKEYYYTVTDETTGCVSDVNTYTVTVDAIPGDLTTKLTQYLKTESPFVDIMTQNTDAVTGAEVGATVMWLGQYETDDEPTNRKGASSVSPTPVAKSLTSSDDETYYYWVYQVSGKETACESSLTKLEVKILGAPAPNVLDTVYCLNGTAADLSTNAEINQADAAKTYELVWYTTATGGTGSTIAPTPSTAELGETTYYVSQRDANSINNESSRMPIKVTVVGVMAPDLTAATTTYCKGDKATALPTTLTEDNAKYYYADKLVWNDGVADGETFTPNTDVAEKTEYTYTAKQSYTIPNTTQICESEASALIVTVNFTTAVADVEYSYLAAEATNNQFASITTKGWEEESGYTYYYKLDGESAYSTTIPSPTYDVSKLSGQTVELTYMVYRVDKTTNCLSETSTITIKISDALPPKVKDVLYCEGETLADLTAEKQAQGTKTIDNYTLLWYGTDKPANTTVAAVSEGDTYPLTGVATVANNAVTKTSYWVAQRDEETQAVSPAQEIEVIVYPKPVLNVTDPAAVCATPVDLGPAVTLANKVDGMVYTQKYYDDEAATVERTATYAVKTGVYYVQSSYDAKVDSKNICVSDAMPITVTIDTLGVKVENVETCPDKSATFTAEASSNVATISYVWSGTGDTGNTPVFETKKFTGGDYGDVYNYTLTVTAGTCKQTKDLTVTLGNGPVVGTLTLSDPTNEDTPTKVYTNGLTTDVFYYCGGDVTVTPNYEGDGDYVLTDPSGSTSTTAPFTINKEGEYTLSFTNGCPTKVSFTTKDAQVKATSTVSDLEICEGTAFTAGLTITPVNQVPYSVSWTKDAVAMVGQQGEAYSISSTSPDDSGLYEATVNRKGCVSKVEVGSLLVKPYIKLTENVAPVVVPRGESTVLNLTINTPADGNVSTIQWFDNGGTSSVNNTSSYSIENVTTDHTYKITLSDPDYCPAETEMTVWVDAVLQLETDLADVLCEGLNYQLTIDTAGTGKFRRTDVSHSLTLIQSMGGITSDVTNKLTQKDGKLVYNFVADKDATFTVNFVYGEQTKTSEETVTVIPTISVTLPEQPTICGGETVDLKVTNIVPEGTTIVWTSDPTIQSSLEATSVTVAPKFNEVIANNHRSIYSYTLKAVNAACSSEVPFAVTVEVIEPLKGELTGVSPICEGNASSVSAESYQAETYQWSVEGQVISDASSIAVNPTETTTYAVAMTRGTCEATANYVVSVTSNPEIVAMDSVGIRDREVQINPAKGTGTFTYWVDDKESAADNSTVIKNLSFGEHVVHVRDVNGCQSEFAFSLVAPSLNVPNYFSPNGDGVNDRWVIPTLAEIYPSAVVHIYDRYGKIIAEYLGAYEGWDGTYNGTPLPSTDYWYVVEIEETETKYTGHFTLLRR